MTSRTKSFGCGSLILALGVSFFPAAPIAQGADNGDVEGRVKAAFVYNFARFVEWPPSPPRQSVRIAVLGRGDLAAPLEEITRGKTVNGRPIEVIRVPSAASVPHCDLLLVERSESKHLKSVVQAVVGSPVLIVCDGPNCLKDGAMIGFQLVEESVRFQINQEAAEKAGLKISSQLLKVALPASGDRP
jgi:hypothetical protein